MKKTSFTIISLILLLSMLFNSICFAAEYYPDVKGTEYEVSVYALAEIRVIEKLTEDFVPSTSVTRAEFAAWLINASELDNAADIYDEKSFFNDVSNEHDWFGYINVAYEYGYITYEEVVNGKDTIKYFYPDEAITYADAITWCVKTLGYTSVIGKDASTSAYITKARELKMLDGVVFDAYENELTKGNAAMLVWNMINTKMWDVVSESDPGLTYGASGTMFEKYFSEYEDEVMEIIRDLESEEISFEDNVNLYNAVKDSLIDEGPNFDYDDTSKTITVYVEDVTELTLDDASISNIEELEKFTALKSLRLSKNQISDIDSLRKMKKLKKLYIGENNIKDLSDISKLTQIEYLCFKKNDIKDISCLSKLTNLKYLSMSECNINDISVLKNFPDLYSVELSGNAINDFSPLLDCTKLEELALSNTGISDISLLGQLKNLNTLVLLDNKITDITPLAELTNLKYLYLSNNEIDDISVLANLKNLDTLAIRNIKIKDISVLSNLTKIFELDLAKNQIQDVKPLANLEKLHVLYLNENNISDMSPILSDLGGQIQIYFVYKQRLTSEIDVNETEIELLPLFKNQEIKADITGNVKITVDKENMTIVNAKAGDKVVLTITNGDFRDSVVTYNFVGTSTAVTPTPTPTPEIEEIKTIYQITAKTPSNGEISPEGTTDVEEGQDITYEIDANKGYDIKDVLVDGESVGKVDEYTFTNVNSNHTIEVTFEEVEMYTITAKKPTNGTLTPTGVTEIEEGENKTYKIKASNGYEIEDVLVDGKSVGKVLTYKFKDVDEDHTIEAKFVKTEEIIEEKIKFDDVTENDWFIESVKYVTEKGLMNGVGDNKFSPNSNTTRGMIVTVLYRLAEVEENDYSTFDDVSKDAYYSKAIAWAAKKGIVNGIGTNKFAPDAEITREQLITILSRYAEIIEKEKMSSIKNNLTNFEDVNKINSYAMDAFKWGVKEGIINGRTEKELEPQGNAKRAEVATMLMRFMER